MSFYLYLLLGFIGGIPAGMGMGGGTVTIPLLTLVGGVEQKIAQCANLFAHERRGFENARGEQTTQNGGGALGDFTRVAFFCFRSDGGGDIAFGGA